MCKEWGGKAAEDVEVKGKEGRLCWIWKRIGKQGRDLRAGLDWLQLQERRMVWAADNYVSLRAILIACLNFQCIPVVD